MWNTRTVNKTFTKLTNGVAGRNIVGREGKADPGQNKSLFWGGKITVSYTIKLVWLVALPTQLC